MPKDDLTSKDIYDKLEEIRRLLSAQLAMFKLVNQEHIETARKEILALDVRKRIFEQCDNKKTVTQIAQIIFSGEPLEKSQPKMSYHLAVLEDYGLVDHRDEKGQRYYFKIRE